ncbi:site-2 protease family protein [Eubacteriales bacterium KG127]
MGKFNLKNPMLIIGIIFLAAFVVMSGGQSFTNKLLFLPGIIIGITFHEAAHGFVSNWLGDPTPKIQGRLSINPIAHIDPVGFIALLLVGFGWGKPVMIDPRYYKNPKRDELLVALAGVTTNLIIALLFTFLQVFLVNQGVGAYGDNIGKYVMIMINYVIFINIVLMCFNLLPVPPLDGFSVITQLFNLKKYNWYYGIYRNGFFILMLLVFVGALDGFLDKSVKFFYYNIMTAVMSLI